MTMGLCGAERFTKAGGHEACAAEAHGKTGHSYVPFIDYLQRLGHSPVMAARMEWAENMARAVPMTNPELWMAAAEAENPLSMGEVEGLYAMGARQAEAMMHAGKGNYPLAGEAQRRAAAHKRDLLRGAVDAGRTNPSALDTREGRRSAGDNMGQAMNLIKLLREITADRDYLLAIADDATAFIQRLPAGSEVRTATATALADAVNALQQAGKITTADMQRVAEALKAEANPNKTSAHDTADWHRARGHRARVIRVTQGRDGYQVFVDGRREARVRPPRVKSRVIRRGRVTGEHPAEPVAEIEVPPETTPAQIREAAAVAAETAPPEPTAGELADAMADALKDILTEAAAPPAE